METNGVLNFDLRQMKFDNGYIILLWALNIFISEIFKLEMQSQMPAFKFVNGTL